MSRERVVIVGGGFTGLTAALELSDLFEVTLLESDSQLGGLASTFEVNGKQLEKFYHHWFTSDEAIMGLIAELGLNDKVTVQPSATGTYYANRHYRLSTPLDLLRFDALSLVGRLRLGAQTLAARAVRNWREVESLTAEEWIRSSAGDEVFEKVWGPLLKGKFGRHAPDVGAVWFWNKLKLRGSSRGKGGREELAYFEGDFGALIDLLADELERREVRVVRSCKAQRVLSDGAKFTAIETDQGRFDADACILTPALPIIADLLRDTPGQGAVTQYESVQYLGNVCLVLNLDRPLSETYWLNVNDPEFPFVAVVEHTNLIGPENYGGANIVYLSRYLTHDDPVFSMATEDIVRFAAPHLKRMFPEFRTDWIVEAETWRARYAQPVVGKHYSRVLDTLTPDISNCYLATR